MKKLETASIVEIFPMKVWMESDFFGNKHVMVQHQDGSSAPFTYCTFHYDNHYTCNSMTWEMAEKIAIALGAKESVERKMREIKYAE